MNTKVLFELNQLRTRIALLEVLHNWEPELQSRIECPFCQSKNVYQRMQPKNGNTYICHGCQQNFSEELLPGCRCWCPGHLQKCQDCPHYQSILPLIKERASCLQGLSRQELENLIGYCELPKSYPN
ncbi:MAG: hypothetical protein ICV63_22035 [Coleofasciculus sp. Co-bin14]|nr:hypothetical protein [Coleofasciculus sp. Co-bin14]